MNPCVEVFAPHGRAAEYSVRVLTEPEPTEEQNREAMRRAREVLDEELARRGDSADDHGAWAIQVKGKRLAFYATATGQKPAKEG